MIDNLKASSKIDASAIESNALFAEARAKRDDVPDGYITIELSTKGKLYAPARVHVRNFTAEDILGLALSDDQTLPLKVIEILNDLILEEDVDIGKFYEDEVVETLFIIYKTFYAQKLTDQPYVLQPDDYKYLEEMHGGSESEDYKKLIRDYKNKKWNPKFNLDLNTVKTYELPENFKPVLKITKRNGFVCKQGFPTYGDVRDLKDFIDIIFKQQDDKYASITNTLKYRQEQLEKRDNGEDIPFESIPNISKSVEKEYMDYVFNRNITVMKAMRAIQLREYRGQDVTDLPIEKKLTLAEDPELDLTVYQAITDKLNNSKIGLQKTVRIVSPVTNKEIDYPFSFRIFDLLQAIQSADSDGITIEYE